MNKLKKVITSASVFTAIIATSAFAYSSNWATNTIYYSDASMTQIVGFGFKDCTGLVTNDGQVTPYKRTRRDSPCQNFGNW